MPFWFGLPHQPSVAAQTSRKDPTMVGFNAVELKITQVPFGMVKLAVQMAHSERVSVANYDLR